MHSFLKKIANRDLTICIVGIGYVGFPLLCAFCKEGFNVVGYDINKKKIELLQGKVSPIPHMVFPKGLEKTPRFVWHPKDPNLSDCDVYIVCVPTPLGEHKEPNLKYLKDAVKHLYPDCIEGKNKKLVIIESTTYPGTTRNELLPLINSSSNRPWVAYSPEREDPGNKKFNLNSIPKVVGGLDEESLVLASELYATIIDSVHKVSSLDIAEATKILENVYRSVNIALVNEMKIIFDRLGLDIWETIEAASTKPFGFQAFYPGPGVGGHCIGPDPFYLAWDAKRYGVPTRFIELAGEINNAMPTYVVTKIIEVLNRKGKSVSGSEILLLGMSYKKDIDDIRESPSLDVYRILNLIGARVSYYDPYVPSIGGSKSLSKEEMEKKLIHADCVVILTDHSGVDYEKVAKLADPIVDTRNAIKDKCKNVLKA